MTIHATDRPMYSRRVRAEINPLTARYASLSDADDIDALLVQAFGSSAPKSSAAREIESPNHVYIVVTTNDPTEQSKLEYLNAQQQGWKHRVKSLFSTPPTTLDESQTRAFLAGVVGIWTPVDQAHIVVIASRPSERGRGVGELMMIATIAEAINKGAISSTLEVRKSNLVARSLYQKYGFTDVGIRHRYYIDNREDAVIMSTPTLADFDYRNSMRRRYEVYCRNRGRPEIQIPNPLELPLT